MASSTARRAESPETYEVSHLPGTTRYRGAMMADGSGPLGPVKAWDHTGWQGSIPESWGVHVHHGEVPETLPGSVEVSRFLSVSADAALVTYKNHARLLVTTDEVRLHELTPLTDQDRQYLIYSWGGRLIRTLQHKFSLHASTALTTTGAVAVLGHARAGKSSTLLGLREAGYPVIADDLTITDVVGEDRVETQAWHRPIHVRQPTAERFGLTSFPRISASLRVDQPYLASNDVTGTHRYQMQLLIQLRPDPTIDQVQVDPIDGVARLMAIKANIDRLGQASGSGRDAPFFRWASAVADRVPMVQIRRPTDRWSMPEVVAAIADLVGPAPSLVDLRDVLPEQRPTVAV